jgi:glycosyltransferase involved in cell wall biosynthesis
MTIAAVILTHNSQASIKNLIRSLSWCDEIIVVDDQSTDRTCAIARKSGAQVLVHPLRRNFAAQRNFGLKQVTADWAVFVDADESVSPRLAQEIRSVLKSNLNGFFIKRIDYFLGQKLQYGETGHLRLLRLARRTAGRWHRPVHETWQVRPPIGQLKLPLYHHPHRNLSDFLAKINYYTDIEARYRPLPGATQLLFYPPAKFIYNYFFKLGFLDGMPGLIMALMMSFHSLLVRLKLYEKTLVGPARHSSAR